MTTIILDVKNAIQRDLATFTEQYENRRLGHFEQCEQTREAYRNDIYTKQREWLQLFYTHGPIDPTGYFENVEYVYTVLKRYCYETYGVNVIPYHEFVADPAFAALIPEGRLPITEENEYIVFSLYLLVQESKAIIDVYESTHADKRARIQTIKQVIHQWQKMKDSRWFERDGFGFYRLGFTYGSDGIFRVTHNREDEGTTILFEQSTYEEKQMLACMDEFDHYLSQTVNRTLQEINTYLEKEQSITLPDLIGRTIDSLWKVTDTTAYLSLGSHGHVLQQLKVENDVLYRLDGRQVYNTETIVREMCESLQEMVADKKRGWAEKEKAEKRAFQLFQSTLSEHDVIGKDYIILTGKEHDYVLLLHKRTVIDFVRITKGKSLNETTTTSLCIHPKDTWIPRYDGFATFSLLIKSGNEKIINQVANHHPIHSGSLRRVQEIYA